MLNISISHLFLSLFLHFFSDRSFDTSSDGNPDDYGSNVTESSTLLPINLSDDNDSEPDIVNSTSNSPRAVANQLNHAGGGGDGSRVGTPNKKQKMNQLPATYSDEQIIINFSGQEQPLTRSQESLLTLDPPSSDQPHPSN